MLPFVLPSQNIVVVVVLFAGLSWPLKALLVGRFNKQKKIQRNGTEFGFRDFRYLGRDNNSSQLLHTHGLVLLALGWIGSQTSALPSPRSYSHLVAKLPDVNIRGELAPSQYFPRQCAGRRDRFWHR